MARRTTASEPPTPEETPGELPAEGVTSEVATATVGSDEPTAGPGEPSAASAGPSAASAGHPFFTWLRGLGVVRQEGWLGGVCGGLAARIGVDPLIVRGIALVLAVVGAPVAFVYAIAWFLLPDTAGTIHARELGHGRVTRAFPGIVAGFLLSFLPLTQGFWAAGALYWNDPGWGGAIARVLVTLVLLGGVVALVVWLAQRASGDVTTGPATTDGRPETVPTFPAEAVTDAGGATAASAATPAAAPLVEPGEPPAPPADASAEELAAWKASQDAWQQQRAAWAVEQRRAERERRQAEANARAQEALAASRERARIRRLTRPRANAGIVFLVLGVALVAGAIAAFAAWHSASMRGAEWIVGAAVVVLVLGLGTVAVALGRRRSGALGFFSILAVLALAVAIVVPTDRQLLAPGVSWGIDVSRDGRYAQLAGTTSIYVADDDRPARTIDLWQAAGGIEVRVAEGASVRIELITEAARGEFGVLAETGGSVGMWARYEIVDGRRAVTIGDPDSLDVVVRIWTRHPSALYVSTITEEETPPPLTPEPDSVERWRFDTGEALPPTPAPSSTPSPTSTEGAAP